MVSGMIALEIIGLPLPGGDGVIRHDATAEVTREQRAQIGVPIYRVGP